MATWLFLSETRLEAWIAEGQAELFDAGIRIPAEDVALALESASYILELVEGEDEAGLLGKVKGERELREAGAEVMGSAMILGETAYEIVPGFLVRPQGGDDETRTFLEAVEDRDLE